MEKTLSVLLDKLLRVHLFRLVKTETAEPILHWMLPGDFKGLWLDAWRQQSERGA